jgi:hypothetical protein
MNFGSPLTALFSIAEIRKCLRYYFNEHKKMNQSAFESLSVQIRNCHKQNYEKTISIPIYP